MLLPEPGVPAIASVGHRARPRPHRPHAVRAAPPPRRRSRCAPRNASSGDRSGGAISTLISQDERAGRRSSRRDVPDRADGSIRAAPTASRIV